MKTKLIIAFIFIASICKAQYCIQVIGDSVIGYHHVGVCPVINFGKGYQIPYNLDSLDIYGNTIYVFKPLTPPNFTNADVVLNPATAARKTSDSLATVQRMAQITADTSLVYSILQGLSPTTTFTAAQQKAFNAAVMWDLNMINISTGKIDRANGYIWTQPVSH